MKLVDEWRHAHRITSVQVGAVIGVVGVVEQFLPGLQGAIPPLAYAALGVAAAVTRLIMQPKLSARVAAERAIK